MADRLPSGEPRLVHFTDSGTTLQPGAWAGPTHVMVVEHRSDETSLIIRSFLDDGEDEEPGDLLENMVNVPSQKIRGGQPYIEQLVFDVCPTSSLPATLEVREPPNAVTFDFAIRKGGDGALWCGTFDNVTHCKARRSQLQDLSDQLAAWDTANRPIVGDHEGSHVWLERDEARA